MSAPAGAAATKPPAAATPPPPTSTPPPAPAALTGELADGGMVRHDVVRSRSWTAHGSGKVLGDVEVERADLKGLISIGGKLAAGELSADGQFDVRGGGVVRGTCTLRGRAVSGDDLTVGSLDLVGSALVDGALRATGPAHWKGPLEVRGPLTGDSVDFEGTLDAEDVTVAGTFHGKLTAASHLGHLTARSVRLESRRALGPIRAAGSMRVLRIDAEEATLEGVDAQFVKAERVTVGPDCHIAQIEGRLLSVHPSSHVGPESRSPRPHGMWR